MWYTVLFVVSASGGNLDSLAVSQSSLPIDVCQEYAATRNPLLTSNVVPGYRSTYACMELAKLEALIAKYDCSVVGTDPSDDDTLYQCKSKARAPNLAVRAAPRRVMPEITKPALAPSDLSPGPSEGKGMPGLESYPSAKHWAVQVGSYTSVEKAQQTADALLQSGHPAFVMPVQSGNASIYRVRLGPFNDRAAANSSLSSIKNIAPGAAIVAHH